MRLDGVGALRPEQVGARVEERAGHPVWLELLGSFRLVRNGESLPIRIGGKTEALLGHLGLAGLRGVPRGVLLSLIWPDSDFNLAANALNNVLHNLRAMLGSALGGASPVVLAGGYYRLNFEAGVAVDVAEFNEHARESERHARNGELPAAVAVAERAVRLYRGDLKPQVDAGPTMILECDRLRSTCLSMLMLLADDGFAQHDFSSCLGYALQLLEYDACREDAHRLVMRCYVRRGERAQALRHYQTVQKILRLEFEAEPEPATTALYHQIRVNPGAV
jgi:DNA-binding SARP family transcriptional activator